jgi:hypothetical protein
MRLDWVYPSRRTAFLAALFIPALAAAQSFVPIFDGETLKVWDGDPAYWRVENGAIENTFLIWRGGSPAHFEFA